MAALDPQLVVEKAQELLAYGPRSAGILYDMLIARGELPINSLKRFRQVLNNAIEDGTIDKRLIVKRIRRETRPNVFRREHLLRLFDTIDNPKIVVACFLGYFCALRVSEV